MGFTPTTSRSLIIFLLTFPILIDGAQRRCYQCRSRTELGDCKDPFAFNATTAAPENGIRPIQCASGWCGKIVEGGGRYKLDDYGVATERFCLQRSPSDGEGRCAHTEWHRRKVFMCFCQGDLCNAAPESHKFSGLLLAVTLLSSLWRSFTAIFRLN